MYEFVKNFYDEYKNEDMFCNVSDDQISDLIKEFGKRNIPMLDSYVRLLGINEILIENLNG